MLEASPMAVAHPSWGDTDPWQTPPPRQPSLAIFKLQTACTSQRLRGLSDSHSSYSA